MIENFNEILKNLEKKQYQPVYFLTGEEPYFIDQVANYITQNVLSTSERDFNLTILYGKETNVGLVLEAALRYPMMAAYNVIIIKEAQELKKIEDLTAYIEKPNPSSILVFCYKYKSLDKRTKLSKSLIQKSCYLESKKLPEGKISAWINNYLKISEFKIQERAVSILTEYIGNDLGRLATELDKLKLIKADAKVINVEDIEIHVGISKEYNLFELQKALVFKDYRKATKIFNFIKNNPKSNPMPLVLGTLFSFFSKVYALKHTKMNFNEAAKELSIPPFLIDENHRAAQIYSGKLDKVINLIHEYDLRSKGLNDPGTSDSELAKELIYRILSL